MGISGIELSIKLTLFFSGDPGFFIFLIICELRAGILNQWKDCGLGFKPESAFFSSKFMFLQNLMCVYPKTVCKVLLAISQWVGTKRLRARNRFKLNCCRKGSISCYWAAVRCGRPNEPRWVWRQFPLWNHPAPTSIPVSQLPKYY